MAEDPRKKSREQRQRIARLKQRAKALMLSKSRMRRDQAMRIMDILADIDGKIAEQNLYQERGSQDLAQHFEPEIKDGLDSADQEISDAEELPEDESEENDNQYQQDNQQDDSSDESRTKRDKRPQEREGKTKKVEPKSKTQSTKTKPTPTAKPVKPPVTAGATGGKVAASAGKTAASAVVKTPHFWIALGVILAIILVIALVVMLAGGAHKSFNESGGSLPIAMDYNNPAHRDLVSQVTGLRDGGALVFIDGTAQDVDWQDDGHGNFTHKLDWRTMVTLKYLGEKWLARTDGIIQVSLLASNAPDFTRRMAVVKVGGAVVGGGSNETPLDAPSVYATGQGIGVSVIGRVSNELAAACFDDHDNNRKNNAPVEVTWQEIVSQEVLRPTYEQLQVDGKQVFEGMKVMQGLAKQAKKSPENLARYTQALAAADSIYTQTGTSLDNMIRNLQKINDLKDKGIDQRTKDYAAMAAAFLSVARGATKTSVLAWDDSGTIQSLRNGLENTFRMMQVANMVGWKTPAKPNCRLWKAYEARQNIRQLVLDLEQMPADPSLVEAGSNWNADLMVRQLIVYSPEDDLDNGLPDMDIFPRGAVAVDEGGVGIDDTGKDGVNDQKDRHFMALPIDGGAFSKASTIFVYKTGFTGIAQGLALDTATGGAASVLDQMHDLFSGTGTSTYSGENLQKVTYKNFVHIGF